MWRASKPINDNETRQRKVGAEGEASIRLLKIIINYFT